MLSPKRPAPHERPGQPPHGPGDRTPATGDVIADRYRVEHVLRAGGMGVILKAEDLHLGQVVAVKLLLPALAQDKATLARFQRETRALARLHSEHIAHILDSGTDVALGPYLVMEYLHGADLGDVLKSAGSLPVAQAADYVIQACKGLSAVHALGIIHRDLKPSNLFLARGEDGSEIVKVLDFGIAKAIGDDLLGLDHVLTEPNMAIGSPRYMSPEQVRSAKHIDTRADIWALGIILYELVAGRPPFDSAAASALCAAIVVDEPPDLRRFAPHAPLEFVALVCRCLSKKPADRVTDVGELVARLLPFAELESRRPLALPAPLARTSTADETKHPPSSTAPLAQELTSLDDAGKPPSSTGPLTSKLPQ
jgi:eukaryotic-like serine/threonine-protein kinase